MSAIKYSVQDKETKDFSKDNGNADMAAFASTHMLGTWKSLLPPVQQQQIANQPGVGYV